MRGLIKIKVKGKSYPFKFGVNATEIFCNLKNVDLDQMNETLSKLDQMTLIDLRTLIYACVKNGQLAEGSSEPIDEMDIGFFVDEMTPTELERVLKAITDGLPRFAQAEKKSSNGKQLRGSSSAALKSA